MVRYNKINNELVEGNSAFLSTLENTVDLGLRLGQQCFLGLTKCTVTLNELIIYIILISVIIHSK